MNGCQRHRVGKGRAAWLLLAVASLFAASAVHAKPAIDAQWSSTTGVGRPGGHVIEAGPGDTLVATGTVRAIEDDGDEKRVEIDLVTVNQKGEPVVTGSATARLPERL